MRSWWKGTKRPPTHRAPYQKQRASRNWTSRRHQETVTLCPWPPLLSAHRAHSFFLSPGPLVCSAHLSTGRTWPPADRYSPVSGLGLLEKISFSSAPNPNSQAAPLGSEALGPISHSPHGQLYHLLGPRRNENRCPSFKTRTSALTGCAEVLHAEVSPPVTALFIFHLLPF